MQQKMIPKIWTFPNLFHTIKKKIVVTISLVDPKSSIR